MPTRGSGSLGCSRLTRAASWGDRKTSREWSPQPPVATPNSSTCGRVKIPHPWGGGTGWKLVRCSPLRSARRGFLEPPALALDFEQMAMMHEAIEERRDHHHVAEEPGPILERPVRGDDGGGLFVPSHEHVGQFVACLGGELAQEEVVDQEQLGATDVGPQLPEVAEFPGLGDVLDELVGLAVQDCL